MKKLFAGSLVAAILLTLLSIRYFDQPLALYILDHLGKRFLFSEAVSNMPDLLFFTAASVSALCWLGYFLLRRRGVGREWMKFFSVLGTSLPLAFALKEILKWLFGRENTRIWVAHPRPITFHWFHGNQSFHGFPSGHMLVFTTIFLALWAFFPRSRALFLSGWIALATALIVTEYHFLGDVVAGSYLGFLVHAGTLALYRRTSRP